MAGGAAWDPAPYLQWVPGYDAAGAPLAPAPWSGAGHGAVSAAAALAAAAAAGGGGGLAASPSADTLRVDLSRLQAAAAALRSIQSDMDTEVQVHGAPLHRDGRGGGGGGGGGVGGGGGGVSAASGGAGDRLDVDVAMDSARAALDRALAAIAGTWRPEEDGPGA
jgi:hypothetical protein